MRARRAASLVAGWLALTTPVSGHSPGDAYTFEGHKFTLDVPEAYKFAGDASPHAGIRSFGFATEPRGDGTHGVITINLIDFKKAGGPPEDVTLDKVAAAMIGGVRQRRTLWTQKESPQEIAGVAGKKIEFSGSAALGPGEPSPIVRGIMIVGIKNDVAFSLFTQDLASVSAGTLPVCEKALLTFALTVKR